MQGWIWDFSYVSKKNWTGRGRRRGWPNNFNADSPYIKFDSTFDEMTVSPNIRAHQHVIAAIVNKFLAENFKRLLENTSGVKRAHTRVNKQFTNGLSCVTRRRYGVVSYVCINFI